MEPELQPSPQLGCAIDCDDVKYVSRLSTIMVAAIQEVKDRISQIEYIFCAQLYPTLESKPKSLQRRFDEATKAAEDGWRNKESQFLIQIEELQHEKEKALEEIQKAEAMKAADDGWKERESQYKIQIEELQHEKKKAIEENEKLAASLEENAKLMRSAEDDWKWKEMLQQFEKEEVCNLKQKALEENQLLVASLRNEKNKSLHNEQLLIKCETEKKLLLDKLETLHKTEELAKLQTQLKQMAEEVAMGKQVQEQLLQQIEVKDYEMVTERKKRKDVVDIYKKLKSQYNFLCNKFGLNTENSLSSSRREEDSFSRQQPQNPKTTHGFTEENLQTCGPASKKSNENSSSHSNIKTPSASCSRPLKPPASVKPDPIVGVKRPVPYWRETRLRQEAGGAADPHDDFLDTPIENIKGKLSKSLKEEEVHDFPVPPPNDNSSDDETQDMMNGKEPVPPKQHQISTTKTGDKGFKYVEPVRKKADRENLKGFECKQCKKFYDAVLPENGKNGENNNRCEHHDGVSRHRYKYVPPMTPEGFWNIGFESEM